MAKKTTPNALTKYQSFVSERWDRSNITGAPYNPRTITDESRKKLQTSLKKVGLLAPITVNRRTGYVVGGHQRLATLDALEGRSDYQLDVAVVDLDDKEERECNLLLNYDGNHGDWDAKALADLLYSADLDMSVVGFDAIELENLFDNDFAEVVEKIYSPDDAPAAVKGVVSDVEELAGIKRRREEYRQKVAQQQTDGLGGSDVTLVFKNEAMQRKFLEHIKWPTDDKWVDGRAVAKLLGLTL